MLNFDYNVPTKIFFGKGRISELARITEFGKTVLFVYGGNSIKRSGLYGEILGILSQNGMTVVELPGVEPNPRIQTVRRGVELCREHRVDVVLAAGGGSVMDCAKVIASGTKYGGDPWDFTKDFSLIKDALPLVTVVTLAATGSEMNGGAVISDLTIDDKMPIRHDLQKPRFSILDPQYTFTMPAYQTGAGVTDIMCHALENYFTTCEGAYLQSTLCEGIIKTCVKYGPVVMENPEDYEARANLLWAGSLAINGLCSLGSANTWTSHFIEHELSAYYDITHGAGLAIVMPHWMRYILSGATAERFARYGREVFGLPEGRDASETAREAIEETARFFGSLGMPLKLSDVNIGDEHFDEMARLSMRILNDNCYVPLTAEDVRNILVSAL